MVDSKLPSTMPRKPLQLVLLIFTTSLVSRRTLELAFTSLTASSIAILATLPIVELSVKIAPTLTTTGREETFVLNPLEIIPKDSNQYRKVQIIILNIQPVLFPPDQ